MTYGDDFRWRAVVLMHVYDVSSVYVSELFGPKQRTLRRWYALFLEKGVVNEHHPRQTNTCWPPAVLAAVEAYVQAHPTFYIKELREYVTKNFPAITSVSTAIICRVLNFDLILSRKVLSKAAREAVPAEIDVYRAKLLAILSYAEQLVFLDETAKDGRHSQRRYGRSKRNTRAVVKLPFRRGKRLSILAALDVHGFFAWEWTEGTFTREKFHDAFVKHVISRLNPWPLPRSIDIMDNAKIHAYPELQDAIHQCGARLIFLPPYCPQLNPIEPCFGLLKRWLQKHANLVFQLYPDRVLDVAMRACTRREDKGCFGTFHHCGYMTTGIRHQAPDALMQTSNSDE